jgi:hypothetical protein
MQRVFVPIIRFPHLPVFIILKSKSLAKAAMGKSTPLHLLWPTLEFRYMGIGLSTSEVNLNRLPGWDKGSYGYHGDDGHSFCSSGTGILYGPTFTTDDYVGCCVNFLDNSCFYTRNGHNLGKSSCFRQTEPIHSFPSLYFFDRHVIPRHTGT